MKTILLAMKRKAVAQGLMLKVRERPDIQMKHEPNYENIDKVIKDQGSDTVLIEVSESGEYDIGYCLDMCTRLRSDIPYCKLLLMCPERNKVCVTQAISSKTDKLIDDFVFYDTSVDYLVSKLLSL